MKKAFLITLFFFMPFSVAQDRYARDRENYERELRDIRDRQEERRQAQREAEESRRRKEQNDRDSAFEQHRSFTDRVSRDICRGRGNQYCD